MSDSEPNWWDRPGGRIGLSVGQLNDGEQATVQIVEEPFERDTAESKNALHVPVAVVNGPEDFTDMSGDPVELVADSENEVTEYNIINSSSGFRRELMEALSDRLGESAGSVIEITAYQPTEDDTSRSYVIERQ